MTQTFMEIIIEQWKQPIPKIELPKVPMRIIVLPPRCLEGEGLESDYYSTLFAPAEDPTLLSLYLDHVEGCEICQEREKL